MIKEPQAWVLGGRGSFSASSQRSATREQTETEMRVGAAQGRPDSTQWWADPSLCLPTLTHSEHSPLERAFVMSTKC